MGINANCLKLSQPSQEGFVFYRLGGLSSSACRCVFGALNVDLTQFEMKSFAVVWIKGDAKYSRYRNVAWTCARG